MVRDESPLLSHPPQSWDNQSLSDLQTPPLVGGGWPVLVYNCEGLLSNIHSDILQTSPTATHPATG